MFERFTKRARNVVKDAQRIAAESHADAVAPQHLLLALLEDHKSLAMRVVDGLGASPEQLRSSVARCAVPAEDMDAEDAAALQAIGIDLAEVVRTVEDNLGTTLGRPPVRGRSPRFGRSARKALELSLREALALEHSYIGTEHLLLGLVRGGDPVVAAAVADAGLTHARLRQAIVAALRHAG